MGRPWSELVFSKIAPNLAENEMDWMTWCTLEKPSWTLAPSTIGLIWQIIYPIITVTFGFVFV